MGNGMNKVLPGLYVGNYRDSKDASQLERHKITHIIAIHDAARRMYTVESAFLKFISDFSINHHIQREDLRVWQMVIFISRKKEKALKEYGNEDKEYLCIMASDSPYQNLSQYFPTCNDFIHSARIQGGNVLIHCLAGMSRSVTIAVAYIMSITTLRWNEALKVVRGARAVSNPNSGFQKQLQDFESTKLPEERRRLLEKFPGTTYLENDEEQCKKLLAAYNNMVLSRVICEGRCTSAKVCPTGTCRAHASPRLGRHKSIESTSSQGSAFTRAGSTKSLDSGTNPQDPGSPKNWERHYGCWKNHFRHRQGTSSTPSTPILYRAAKRTDSVTSISSMSSVSSLVGSQNVINEDVKDHASGSGSGGATMGASGMTKSMLERNPFLATQSCPNSPRRTPKKLPQGRGGGVVARAEISNLVKISSVSSISSTEKLTTTTKVATTTVSSTSSSATNSPVPATKCRPSSASAVLSSSTAASSSSTVAKPSSSPSSSASAGGAAASTSTSSPSSSPWATPPGSPANRSSLASQKKTTKNVTVTASGATRWVMKRSAYKFSLDNS